MKHQPLRICISCALGILLLGSLGLNLYFILGNNTSYLQDPEETYIMEVNKL